MEIWIPILYPFIFGAVSLYFYRHKIVWWELCIPIAVSLIFIGTFRFFVIKSITTDTEYWGGTIQKVEYFEDWNEYIHRTCYRRVRCGKSTCSIPYDCSYVQYHPEYYQVTDNNGFSATITQSEYTNLAIKFKQQPKFVEMNRNSYTNDGDKYVFYWQGERETFEPMFTEMTYENRVQASHSVYNYPEVTEDDMKKFHLFEYPEIKNHKMKSIIGFGGETQKKAEEKFTWINAHLGKPKQLHTFVLIFQGGTINNGLMQERYWKGGNDNEFIICIGVDSSHTVLWCHTFAWSEAQEPKITIRDFVLSQDKLDLCSIADFCEKELQEKFVRKDFKDFSYLTVDPPVWAIIWCHIITFIISLGTMIWAIRNDIHNNDSEGRNSEGYFYRTSRGW